MLLSKQKPVLTFDPKVHKQYEAMFYGFSVRSSGYWWPLKKFFDAIGCVGASDENQPIFAMAVRIPPSGTLPSHPPAACRVTPRPNKPSSPSHLTPSPKLTLPSLRSNLEV